MRDRAMRTSSSIPSLHLAVCALLVAATGCRDQPPPIRVSAEPSDAARPIAFDPPQGAIEVDPSRTTLSVTFDRPMDPQGWAWVIEGAMTAPELGESAWDPETRTNTVETKLEPGRDYVVWDNSPQYLYFKDQRGVPATPTRWTFSTAGERMTPSTPAAEFEMLRTTPSGPPRVIRLEPPNGASSVDPELAVLRATFDRPMQGSWSWVTEGHDFPETTGDAFFESDQRTAALPVRLEPGRTYVVWLNSEQYQLFRDHSGRAAQPLRWTFTTRAGP